MEIPDLIVLNKADNPQVNVLRSELKQVLGMAEKDQRPPVIETRATDGYGVPELWRRVLAHQEQLAASGQLEVRRREHLQREVFALATARAARHLQHQVEQRDELRRLLEDVGERRVDPLTAVTQILERVYELDGE
jgi:LAO/AO transport system kinase